MGWRGLQARNVRMQLEEKLLLYGSNSALENFPHGPSTSFETFLRFGSAKAGRPSSPASNLRRASGTLAAAETHTHWGQPVRVPLYLPIPTTSPTLSYHNQPGKESSPASFPSVSAEAVNFVPENSAGSPQYFTSWAAPCSIIVPHFFVPIDP